MDIQTAVIGLGVFILSAAVLLFVALFGIKQKTYEEALAEQRQQTHALLGTKAVKPKDKRSKKDKKKVRTLPSS